MEGGHDPTVSPKQHHEGTPPVPPDVFSWYVATGSSLFANHPQTVTMPPFVFSWWEATGSAFWATKLDPNLQGVTTAPAPTEKPTGPGPGAGGGAAIPPPLSSVTTTIQISISTLTLLTPTFSPPPSKSTSTSSASTADSSGTSTPTNTTSTSSSFPVPSDAVSPTTTPSSTPSPINAVSNKKTARIIAGVVVPLVLIFIGVAAFIIYKRRRRARDRREWERTHDAIADAVRRVGDTPAPGLPAWRPPYNDVKAPLEGDTAPLFEKSGDPSLPGPLEHTGGEFHSGPPSSLV